jgi:hypothetical protein
MPVPSPKCTTHEPLTPSPSCRPRADLIQNCPTLGILRPLYLLGLDSHSALPISARNTSTELYLARSATHRPNLSGSHLSLTPKLEVSKCFKILIEGLYIHRSTCAPHEDYQFDLPTSILTFCFSCHLLEALDEDAMLGPRSRFSLFSVISSLIRRTLEFQYEQDLVGPINHN